MPLAQFLNYQATIIRRSSSGDEDEYGNELKTPDEEDVLCEVQQQQRSEPGDQAELSDTRWLGVFPADTDLSTADALDVDGVGRFEFVGDPWNVPPGRMLPGHVESTLRRTGESEAS